MAYVVGDRGELMCRLPWKAILASFRGVRCHTDFWVAYSNVLLVEQRAPVVKQSGQTAHVGRWNMTLRQRLARFVRRTLSLSKSSQMR